MSPPRQPLARRMVLRGGGAAIALPALEAMSPRKAPPSGARARFVAIEMVHGAAGSTDYGRAQHLWFPAAVGERFELTPSLASLEPYRDRLTIVSNLHLAAAETWSPAEDGQAVDHARSSAAFLTGAHPQRTRDAAACGPSIDQLVARQLGRGSPVRSLELSVEPMQDASDLEWPAGYSPAYRHAISWTDAHTPAPPEHRPDVVFRRLFGAPVRPGAQASVLDGVGPDARDLRARLSPADRIRLEAHLTDLRALEGRIEARKADAAAGATASFRQDLRILGDLIALAFAADLTRVCTLKLGLDRSQRTYPESGVAIPFHTASHHRQEPEKIEAFARLNAFHVGGTADLLDRLQGLKDGEASLLDRTLVLYGSPMGDSHVHGHENLPVFLAGRCDGMVRGGRHVVCAPRTPWSNLLLTLGRRLGAPLQGIGQSTGEISI